MKVIIAGGRDRDFVYYRQLVDRYNHALQHNILKRSKSLAVQQTGRIDWGNNTQERKNTPMIDIARERGLKVRVYHYF